ncbi:uncharacterized protein METZ01_LOCUS348763, partial [marine metagenome]
MKIADTADPETVDTGQFAGIDNETAAVQRVIKYLELEIWVGRGQKCHDDRGLNLIGQIGLETHRPHAFNQNVAIVPIARAAPDDTAFIGMLRQSLVERGANMGRWRKAPFAGFLQRRPLIVQI